MTKNVGLFTLTEINNEGISPFLGKCDSNKILDWWKIRSILASRNMIRDILEIGLPQSHWL